MRRADPVRAAVALAVAALAVGVRADPPVDIATVDLQALLDLPVQAATLREERAAEAAASVFVLSGDDVRRQGFRTLQEALRSVPGLFTYRDDLYPMLGVRGLGLPTDYTTRVLVLLDGHPLNNSVALGESYLGRDLPVPLTAVQRIEVIKGPVGSIYGPTAFLGVVNVVTEGGPASETQVWTEAEATQGRFAPGAVGLQAAGPVGDADAFLSAEAFHTDGHDYVFPELLGSTDRPPPPGGQVAGMGAADAVTAFARAGWRGLRLVAACNRSSSGTPTAPFQSQLGDARNGVENHTCFGQLSWDRRLADDLELAARASYDDFAYGDTFIYPPPPGDVGVYRDEGTDRWLAGDARLTWWPAAGTRLTGGTTVEQHWTTMRSWAEAPEVGVGQIRKDFAQLNAYALAEQALGDHLRLHAGVTLFLTSLPFSNHVSPKAAAVWTPTAEDVVKLVYAEGFRAPTVSEAYFEDGTDYQASPSLTPEIARSLELSAEHRFGKALVVTASGFENWYRDLIQYRSVPARGLANPDPLDPGEWRQQALNVEALHLHGAELSANVSLGDALRAWGGVSWQQVDDAGFANFPELTGNASVSTCAPWRPLTLALHGAFGGSRRKFVQPAGGPVATVPAFAVLGAAATLDVPGTRTLSVQLAVDNLLDTTAASPLTADSRPITELREAPRTWRLAVRWRFE